MLNHTRINLVLVVMVSLCLGSVMAAQTPVSGPTGSDSASSSISQRAEALAVDVLLESAPCAPQRQTQQLEIPALVGNGSNTSTGRASGIEMPFFSFGGASAE